MSYNKIMRKSKVTNEQLLKEIKGGFRDSRQYTDERVDNLAGMVQRGFDGVGKRLDKHDKHFEENKEWQRLADGKFDVLEHELLSIKKDLQKSFIGTNLS